MTKSPFKAGTGLMGATEPGQIVTPENVHFLPPGSVVRIHDESGSRMIHLHDDLWLWCNDTVHVYDRVENLLWRLQPEAVLCHIPVTAAQR